MAQEARSVFHVSLSELPCALAEPAGELRSVASDLDAGVGLEAEFEMLAVVVKRLLSVACRKRFLHEVLVRLPQLTCTECTRASIELAVFIIHQRQ